MLNSPTKHTTTIQQAIERYKQEASPPDSGGGCGEWVIDANYGEIKRFVSQSYAGRRATSSVSSSGGGDPVFDWASNHITGSWYTDDQHLNNIAFVLDLACYDAFQQKPLIVSKRETATGEFSIAAIIYEYDPAKHDSSCVVSSKIMGHNCHLDWARTKLLTLDPAISELWNSQGHEQDARDFEEKWKHMITKTEDGHKNYGPQEVHWHLFAVGGIDDPEQHNDNERRQQGNRPHGRELLAKIHYLADEVGVACYIECGVSHKAFYESLGYYTSTQLTIEDPVDRSRDPLILYAMVRNPLPPSPHEDQYCVLDQVVDATIDDERLGQQPIASMVVEAQCFRRPGPVWVSHRRMSCI